MGEIKPCISPVVGAETLTVFLLPEIDAGFVVLGDMGNAHLLHFGDHEAPHVLFGVGGRGMCLDSGYVDHRISLTQPFRLRD